MPANVETMFSVNEVPWHKLGTIVKEAPTSKEAIQLAGLDWCINQTNIKLDNVNGERVDGFKANVRSSDNKILSIVSDKYKVIQNQEAFDFTDELLSEGVTYETAGSLRNGKTIWLLARMPEKFKILGDDFINYLVFTNSHDGSSPLTVALTPIRVVCQNTLNLALSQTARSWSTKHLGDMKSKLDFAHTTLSLTKQYQKALSDKIVNLNKIKLSNTQVESLIEDLLPIDENKDGRVKIKHMENKRKHILNKYNSAYDLKIFNGTAYQFVNAVSDAVTHNFPDKSTKNYNEALFASVIKGNYLIDKSFNLVESMF